MPEQPPVKLDFGDCFPQLSGADIGTNEINQCQWGSGGSESSFSRNVNGHAEMQIQLTVTDEVNVKRTDFRTVTIGTGPNGTLSADRERADAQAAAPTTAPEEFTLEEAAPNPVRNRTAVRYGLPETAEIRVTVYDVAGRRVRALANGTQEAGWHTAQFEAADLPGGVYLVRMTAGDGFVKTKRLVVAR